MSASMFRRAVRFVESGLADPAENRLTEITAAILERHAPLARAFTAALLSQAERNAAPSAQPRVAAAQAWLVEHGPAADVQVATQLARGGRFVDMQLRLSCDPLRRERDLVVWVEIKHGADISGSQLPAYVELIEEEPATARTVFVLAPRQSPPSQDLVPDTVPVLFWEQVLADYTTRLPPEPPGSAGTLLSNELLSYMQEENLMPAQPLTIQLALALAVRQATNETVTALCEVVHERVGGYYAGVKAKGGGMPQYGTGFWATHTLSPAAPEWRGAWLEWGLRDDNARRDPRRAYAFVAGASFHRSDDVTADPRYRDWLGARLSENFEHVTDVHPRLWSYRYPEQLLIASSFEAQADLLVGWVLERFDTVTAHHPSPS